MSNGISNKRYWTKKRIKYCLHVYGDKECSQCGVVYPESSFHKATAKTKAYGLRSVCKTCVSAAARQKRLDNIDQYRERDRIRDKTRVTSKAQRSRANYVAKFPKRRRANLAVYRAVKEGEIERHPCEVCKDNGPWVHAHHDDYNKPLEVRWLCALHHTEWHRHNEVIE